MFHFGQRIQTTVDRTDLLAPSGSHGTVIYPLDEWGDYGVLLDGDSAGGMRAYGEDELVSVADAPDWVQEVVGPWTTEDLAPASSLGEVLSRMRPEQWEALRNLMRGD